MTFWRLTAYRESGFVSECPVKFTDLEAARLSAELALLHFGEDFTIMIEEEDDGPESFIRSTRHEPARNSATNNFTS